MAWDPYGCGGYCGFRWFNPDQVALLVSSGTPTVRHTKRRRGNHSQWTSGEGKALVVAEDAVRWADLLA